MRLLYRPKVYMLGIAFVMISLGSCLQKKKGVVASKSRSDSGVVDSESRNQSDQTGGYSDDLDRDLDNEEESQDEEDSANKDDEPIDAGEENDQENEKAKQSNKPSGTKSVPKTDSKPTPSKSTSSLAPSLNISLGSSSGSVKLSSIFSTKYLLIDFSQPGCGPCISHAKQFNSSYSMQNRYSGKGACKAITIVNPGSLGPWRSAVGGATTATGRSSYEYGFSKITSLLNTSSIRSTPWFILIDRTGRVLGSSAGREPPKASELCR